MPFDSPRAICPEIIHGKKFSPDNHGVKDIPFTLIKKGESNCDIRLNGKEYQDLHVIEFLNACAVIGWDHDYSKNAFILVSDRCPWFMTLSKIECRNVEKLFDYIFDNQIWDTKNSKKGGGKGFV